MISGEKRIVPLPMEQLVPVLLLQLQNRGSAELIVTGTSMLPMLHHLEDRVILGLPGTIKKGDIVLYRRNSGQYVLHRVVKSGGETCLCCGDHQSHREQIQTQWILAVVTAYYRKEEKRSLHTPAYRSYVWFRMASRPVRGLFYSFAQRVGGLCKFKKTHGGAK